MHRYHLIWNIFHPPEINKNKKICVWQMRIFFGQIFNYYFIFCYQTEILCSVYVGLMVFSNFARCELEVRIADGTLKGKVLRSRDGRSYYSYTSIPYAKPPIGELRFKVKNQDRIIFSVVFIDVIRIRLDNQLFV